MAVQLDLEYWHVDVFSRVALRGNGLVVVLSAEDLSAAIMQELTREVRQFETSFLSGIDLPGRTANVRIFTEDEELDFAGHPVLGSAAVLHSLHAASGEAEVGWTLQVAGRSILVRTRTAAGWVDAVMDQGQAEFGETLGRPRAEQYAEALGLGQADLHPALPMQVVSTGLPYLIVPLRSGIERAGIAHAGFEDLLAECGAKFVYVLDPERPEGRTWDNAGRVEDVATGSAAGPAAGYLLARGVHPAGEPLLLHQGRFTGRPSTIDVRQDRDGRLWVGGPVAPVATGRFRARLTQSV